VESGKVRFVGASNYLAWRLEQAHWVSETNAGRRSAACSSVTPISAPKPGATFGAQVSANADLLDYVRARRHDFTLLA